MVGSKRISFQGLTVSLKTYSRGGELGEDFMETVERITGQGAASPDPFCD